MSERNLYRGLSDFQGSVDDDGNLYDERHRLVGRIDGDTVYDYCNTRQGTIDANGKLWDVNHTYVGEAHGSNFIGPSYQSTGMARGDSFDDGDGSAYGALMMLKKRNEHYSGNPPDSNYEFGNDYSGDDDDYDDEGDDYDDEGDGYGDNLFSSGAPSYRRGGKGESPESELLTERGCIVSVLFLGGFALVMWLLYQYVMHP